MYNMGYMCLNGWGGEMDADICVQWLDKAVSAGHMRSAKWLSKIYSEGKYGIKANEEKASYYGNFAQN